MNAAQCTQTPVVSTQYRMNQPSHAAVKQIHARANDRIQHASQRGTNAAKEGSEVSHSAFDCPCQRCKTGAAALGVSG
jgi:hypothetical protein